MGSLGALNNSVMLCAPLKSQSVELLVSEMSLAKAQGADVVEVRLDHINNFQPRNDLQVILRNNPLPVILAHSLNSECDEYLQLEALQLALELGADYVEVEFKAASHLLNEVKSKKNYLSGRKIIVSYYVDAVTPPEEELSHLVASMRAAGADIIKLVTKASDITEIARIFHLLSHCQVPLIAYSVGERGLISQILCPKFGGFLVYGSLEGNSVPGLPTLDSLHQAYKVKQLNVDTKVFGLISKPVSHSKGPILHNPAFRHLNYNGVYVPMFVDDLNEFFRVFQSPDFTGFSVGIPYKEAVTRFCDEVHHLAQSIGAVNTIIKRASDGKLVGYNTDCEASITAIEDALIEHSGCGFGKVSNVSFKSLLSGRLFVLVGAGGAGRALAFGAKSRGARVVVFDIDSDRAKSLACAVSGEALLFEDLVSFQPEKGAILANATPLGMHPNPDRIPVAEATLGDYELVFDSVYTPRKTRLLKEAEAAGAIIVSGVEMFLRQAIGQFNLFTGKQAPMELMREIILTKF